MLRKLSTRLFILFLLFFTWYNAPRPQIQSTSSLICNDVPVFPAIQIELLKSTNTEIADDALSETTKELLAFLSPYLLDESWQAECLFLNLIPEQEPQVVIVISAPPDDGLLVVLQKQNNQYILVSALDDLLPVAKLSKLQFQETSELLITREDYREMLGSYSEARQIKIWGWSTKGLYLLWSDFVFSEVSWLSTHEEAGASVNYWNKLRHDAAITYSPSPLPVLTVNCQQSYHRAHTKNSAFPGPHDLPLIAARDLTLHYRWDEEWKRFILNTGMLVTADGQKKEKVAILYDQNNHCDSLAAGTIASTVKTDKYQVLNSQGEIFFAERNNIIPD